MEPLNESGLGGDTYAALSCPQQQTTGCIATHRRAMNFMSSLSCLSETMFS